MRRERLFPILLIVITLLVFGRIATHDFTYWDDPGTLFQNPRLNPPTIKKVLWYWTHTELGIYIPFTYTVWGAIAAIARLESPDQYGIALNPWLFHSVSILVHVGSGLLVYQILRRIIRNDGASFAGALLFALHPVQVESVGWASGLKDVLCGFFAFLSIWQYMKAIDNPPNEAEIPPSKSRRNLHYIFALLAFIFSMLSKPTGMLTPLLAAIIAYFCLQKPLRQIALTLGPWFILSALCALVARLVQTGEGVPSTPLWTRPLIVGDSLAFYLIKLIAPVNLTVDYGRRPTVVVQSPLIYFAWLLPAIVGFAIWSVRKKYPLLVPAALLFVAGVLPLLGLVRFLMQYFSTVADHYLYMPMLGPALALAWLLSYKPNRILKAAAAVWLTILGFLSIAEAGHWENELTLWAHTLEVNPHSFAGHVAYANALSRRGRDAEADVHYRRAIEVNPSYAQAYDAYAFLLIRYGRIDDAIQHIRKHIATVSTYPSEIRPNIAKSHTMLGQVLLTRGKTQEAIGEFEKALKVNPDYKDAHDGLRAARQRLTTQPTTAP
jgi:Tfp pilus assembly protein PilF